MRPANDRTRAAAARARASCELLGPREVLADDRVVPAIPEGAREERLHLGGAVGVARGQQRISCLGEHVELAFPVVCPVHCAGPAEQEVGPLVVVGPQLERLLVLRGGDGEAVQGERAVPRVAQREPRALGEVVVLTTGSPHELERRAPVVREHLRVILGTAEARDPLGGRAMSPGTVGTGDLPVRDVADERVGEGELALALERRAALATDEALALERVQRRRRGICVAPHRARPEHLADDGGVLEQLLLGVGQAVEPRGDDPLERLREAELAGRALLDVQLDELLCVEGVAAGALEERLL